MPPDEHAGRGGFAPADLVAIAMVSAAISLAISGFVFGLHNNMFHLPIVGSLYDEPQFAGDPFIQSLRWYAAGPWLLLRGADRYVDPYWLFLGLDYFSRVIAFIGFLLCASLIGVSSRRQRVLFAGLTCLSSLLYLESYAGGGGLFIRYFTHSEIANGLTLISLFFAARGRLTAAFAANGAVFFVNGFVGVWNAVPLGLIIVFLLVKRRLGWFKAILDGTVGLAIFGLFATPIVLNILSNPNLGGQLHFDYVTYLTQYWPFHFLFAPIRIEIKIAAASVVALGVVSLWALGKTARPFHFALWGYVAVYALGIAAPVLTHSATVLNLHLLRVSLMFHLLAVLASAALMTRWLTSGDPKQATVFAPTLAVLLCTHRYLAVFAPIVVVLAQMAWVSRRLPSRLTTGPFRLDRAVAIGLCLVWPVIIWRGVANNQVETSRVAEWTALGQWARLHTPETAVFLVATQRPAAVEALAPPLSVGQAVPRAGGTVVPQPAPDDPVLFEGTLTFEYVGHRRVWVDFKRGAAVMWAPPYYSVWWPRMAAVLALRSHRDRMAYARANGIGYLVEHCSAAPDAGPPPLFRTAQLCLYAVTSG